MSEPRLNASSTKDWFHISVLSSTQKMLIILEKFWWDMLGDSLVQKLVSIKLTNLLSLIRAILSKTYGNAW